MKTLDDVLREWEGVHMSTTSGKPSANKRRLSDGQVESIASHLHANGAVMVEEAPTPWCHLLYPTKMFMSGNVPAVEVLTDDDKLMFCGEEWQAKAVCDALNNAMNKQMGEGDKDGSRPPTTRSGQKATAPSPTCICNSGFGMNLSCPVHAPEDDELIDIDLGPDPACQPSPTPESSLHHSLGEYDHGACLKCGGSGESPLLRYPCSGCKGTGNAPEDDYTQTLLDDEQHRQDVEGLVDEMDALGRPHDDMTTAYLVGWHKRDDEVAALLEQSHSKVVFFQVKEKFGGLRVYASGTDAVHDKIEELENRSFAICEDCGASGKHRTDLGWWQTLCDSCHAAIK